MANPWRRYCWRLPPRLMAQLPDVKKMKVTGFRKYISIHVMSSTGLRYSNMQKYTILAVTRDCVNFLRTHSTVRFASNCALFWTRQLGIGLAKVTINNGCSRNITLSNSDGLSPPRSAVPNAYAVRTWRWNQHLPLTRTAQASRLFHEATSRPPPPGRPYDSE